MEAGGDRSRRRTEAGGGPSPAGTETDDDRVDGDRAGEDRGRRGQRPGAERNGSGGTSATRLAVSKPRANLNRRNPGFQVPPIVP